MKTNSNSRQASIGNDKFPYLIKNMCWVRKAGKGVMLSTRYDAVSAE